MEEEEEEEEEAEKDKALYSCIVLEKGILLPVRGAQPEIRSARLMRQSSTVK